MRHRSPILFVLTLLIAAPAFSQATRSDMIVSTEWLAQRLDGQVIVVEVGEKSDYGHGHIPSARLLERRSLLVRVDNIPNEVPPVAELEALLTRLGVGDQSRVVFYSCEPLLATRAWFTFDYLGQGQRASVLNGGYARWIAEGRTITTDVPKFEPATFTADPNRAALTTLSAMKAMVRGRRSLGKSLVMIDARPDMSYRGQFAGAGVYRAGHIPGATNIYWQRNLTDLSDGALFRSDDQLRALYENAGVTKETTVITYCRTGVEASMTYFVLRYLGFDPSLYDGSFVEWSGDEDTPVTSAGAR
ncbi:MAG TPA: sulfurtransferase [Thermoanaerobaculia bacterium]|jgi:thiosulfate/3-mercaptopyruvate sulfurtransferase|nr:sulfurtransferase [Thermoanaerobaculia bacterium]